MINYFNCKPINNDYLLTNDFGEFAFVSSKDYKLLLEDKPIEINKYNELVEKGFIIDNSIEVFISENAHKIQNMKSYCLIPTALHIFAVTNMCNLDCIYCQAHSRSSKLDGKMSIETGRKAIEMALQSPSQYLTFEFQGGEPLINFNVVKDMILYSQALNKNICKNIEYTIVTNLTLLEEDKLKFLLDNNVSICTSLDGPQFIHDFNRPLRNNHSGSYAKLMDKVFELKNKGIHISAIQTTTKKSLEAPIEIIKQYADLGINYIFLRPLTPLGLAESAWNKVGYTAEEYMTFYRLAFNYIMELNKSGEKFVETHAAYFLKKILGGFSDNYMELRSPCGATFGQMSYYYDGNVYTCDEGRMMSEMGDYSFKLGNVYENKYEDLIDSPVCHTLCKASIIESLPKCNDCAYQPYCGTCPVVNYAYTKDLYSRNPMDFRCYVYKGIMDILFDVIYKNDEKEMEILYSWIQ